MPRPSHNSLMVTIPGFLLSPLMMLFKVEGGTAEIFANAFNVSLRSSHSFRIRFATFCLLLIRLSFLSACLKKG